MFNITNRNFNAFTIHFLYKNTKYLAFEKNSKVLNKLYTLYKNIKVSCDISSTFNKHLQNYKINISVIIFFVKFYLCLMYNEV